MNAVRRPAPRLAPGRDNAASVLQRKRIDQGMTQLQVALKLGVTERYWRVLETLERRVPNHLVGDVAEIFGVSVDELRSWLVPEEELDEAAS